MLLYDLCFSNNQQFLQDYKTRCKFYFNLAKRLVLPKEYKLLEKIINRIKLEDRSLLEANTINNLIDTIIFENYQDLLVDGHIDHIIRNSQLSVELKLQLHSKRNMIYFYFDYVRQINEADYEQDLLKLRNELSNDKILPFDLKNNLIQMIDKIIADENNFKYIRIQPKDYESELTRLITEVDDLKVRVLQLEKDNLIIKRNLLQCQLLDEELNDII
ncbi:hypothetical protein C2G38_2225265 [Gigaspora rosea]|uniref:Uncharacterized protein n=1 Tax=Gigaspora rosea TaxID=44941 RepID=A0A397TZG7_9GLOM|nr:hypothetical protein C2G38_2225265 [Gigaspora rosea]